VPGTACESRTAEFTGASARDAEIILFYEDCRPPAEIVSSPCTQFNQLCSTVEVARLSRDVLEIINTIVPALPQSRSWTRPRCG
jgi:hypothetical protein